jgi:hypothetical protein
MSLRSWRCGKCGKRYFTYKGAMRCWWRHECARVENECKVT